MKTPIHRREFMGKAGVAWGALVLTTVAARPRRPREEEATAGSLETSDGLIAFRVGSEHWMTEERLDALLTLFGRHSGIAEELAFFTAGTHPPLPLDEIRRRSERLAAVLPRVRAAGMGAGVNHLATMGHHEENLPGSLDEPWQRVVDPHGRESRGSYCPAGPEFLGYVVEVYRLLAATNPDFLWLDDDIRLAGHMPIGFTCFCGACIRRFGDRHGESFTRETLVHRFGTGTWEERKVWRQRWLEHNRATLDALFQVIEKTVHSVRPALSLGFMTGDRFYEGYDFARWAGTLAGPGGVPVRWRPGGGFYSDETLSGLVGKANDIGRQVAQLPRGVTIIQSEIENFPYDLLRKSAEATVVEAAAHMAAGTTGTAFNVLSQRPDPLEEYEPLFRRIRSMRPFYLRLRRQLGRRGLVGVWPGWCRDVFVANKPDGNWPEGGTDAITGLNRCHVLGELGIPLCYDRSGAVATALAGPGLLAFDRQELESIFAGGVLLDIDAWHALERLGLSKWTGVRPGTTYERDAMEVLTADPLNGRFAGWSRDCRQSFWREPAVRLEPVSGDVGVLARMMDYQGADLGPSMTTFTNALGGRVVVMGYYPWSQMHHLAKSSQMKAVCAWLSHGRLPVWVESFARIHVWSRQTQEDETSAVILNASLDPATRPTLRWAHPCRRVEWFGMDDSRKVLRVEGDGRDRVRLPDLDPWRAGLVVARA